VRDLISQHAAFPQPAFEREGLGLSKKVRILPNPCSFSINEVLVSLASPDVLFHLRREEVFQVADEAVPDPSVPVSKNPQGDGMANLVRHVLGQRTFYPLFPAPEDLAHDVNLDVTHWHNLRLEDTAPDILILPSRLKHFSKVVDSTLALNPGHLSRANTAGTFTKLMIHPSKSLVDDGEYQEHRVDERTRSEVWRI
jgi:DNA polymerase alpha subunit B